MDRFQTVLETQQQVHTILAGFDYQRHKQLLPLSGVTQHGRRIKDVFDDDSDSGVESSTDIVSRNVSDSGSRDPVNSALTASRTETHFLVSAVAQSSCDLDCGCTCHKTKRSRSPKFLDLVLGSIFIGYRMSPIFTSSCSNLDCQMKATKITYTYAFPDWFMKGVLHTSISFDRSKGPELNLRVMNVRPRFTPAFTAITFDKGKDAKALANVQKLMDLREASVLDVNPDGDTLLSVCEPCTTHV